MKRVLKTAVAVSNTKASVLDINVNHETDVGLSITNTGANPLTEFEVAVKFHGDDAWLVIADAAGEFAAATSSKLLMLDSNISPVTLAAGATAWLSLESWKVAELRLLARTGAALTTTLTIAGIAK